MHNSGTSSQELQQNKINSVMGGNWLLSQLNEE